MKKNLLAGFEEGVPKTQPTATPETPTTPSFQLGPLVPNRPPRLTCFPYRIAIIGEAPGKDEETALIPFVGATGYTLDKLLGKAAIVRDGCFVGNICQYRPPVVGKKQMSPLQWAKQSDQGREALTKGVAQLEADLKQYKPNLCILLGNNPLHIAKGVEGIGDWRGSIFISDRPGPFYGLKCLPTYHPAACNRNYEWMPQLWMDLVKAKRHAETPDLVLPPRQLKINLTFDELCYELDKILRNKPIISPDIEGGVGSMSCCSLATSWDYSILVPFANMDGSSYWPTLEEEVVIWTKFAAILADYGIPKVWQNGLYDRFVLQYSYALFSANNHDDTMLKFWEKYCELDKGLAFQCSVLLDYESYYKFERKTDSRDVHYTYCCKDSANTFAINQRLEKLLDLAQLSHYRQNNALLNPLLYMMLKGIRYATKEAKARLREVNEHIYSKQANLDTIAGVGFNLEQLALPEGRTRVLATIQQIMCKKRDQDSPKKDYEDAYPWAKSLLLGNGSVTSSDIGRLSIACKTSMNLKSPRFKTYLYETLGLPVQYKKDLKTYEMRPTTDYEALLKLTKKTDHPSIRAAIDIGMHRTRAQMLSILPTKEGRMHCSYNLVGSETARISSSRSMIYGKQGVKVKRIGTNMQTVSDDWDIEDEELVLLTEGLRSLYQADEGYYFFQCDLKGSDGWTIGAYLKMLGDDTMLEDLKYNLKPAQIVCYLRRHGNQSLFGKSRAEIKLLLQEVKKEDWDYYVSKQVIWGTCYTMGPRKVADQILKESYGKVVVTEQHAREFQNAVHARYHIRLWHNWLAGQLKKKPELTAPNGFRRRFFGRDTEILGQALAHIPQVITTYATNQAMYRLWTDTENKMVDKAPTLRIQPLHQVHDALCMQARIEDTPWAITKIKQYFDNPITIAGITFTIPFDGAYGPSWGELPFPIK